MPFGWGLWVWLKNNPAAQWAVGIGAGAAAFMGWLTLRDRRRAREIRRELQLKGEANARKVVERAREKTNDTIRKADEARAAIPRGAPSGELPDDIRDILFDN